MGQQRWYDSSKLGRLTHFAFYCLTSVSSICRCNGLQLFYAVISSPSCGRPFVPIIISTQACAKIDTLSLHLIGNQQETDHGNPLAAGCLHRALFAGLLSLLAHLTFRAQTPLYRSLDALASSRAPTSTSCPLIIVVTSVVSGATARRSRPRFVPASLNFE